MASADCVRCRWPAAPHRPGRQPPLIQVQVQIGRRWDITAASLKSDHIALAAQWAHLARSYDFAESLSGSCSIHRKPRTRGNRRKSRPLGWRLVIRDDPAARSPLTAIVSPVFAMTILANFATGF